MAPYSKEVLVYLHEFRVTSLLHSLPVSVTLSASIAQTRDSNPGYVVYRIYDLMVITCIVLLQYSCQPIFHVPLANVQF